MHNTDSIHLHYILAKFNTSNTSDNTSFNTSWLVSHYISIHPTIHCSIHPAKSQYIQYILHWTCNTSFSTSCQFSIHVSTSPSTSLDTSWRDSIHVSTSFNTSCHENNTSKYILQYTSIHRASFQYIRCIGRCIRCINI